MSENKLEVSCYSGQTYAERPESFRWRDKEYRVEEIVRAWQEPGKRCFDIRTTDKESFRLCYNEIRGCWSIIQLSS